MEYIGLRYYSTIILWASPFAFSGIIRNYDGEFPYKIARTLFRLNNISYVHVGRMIIRPSNESGRSRTIDIYVRCFPDSWPRRTHFHTTPERRPTCYFSRNTRSGTYCQISRNAFYLPFRLEPTSYGVDDGAPVNFGRRRCAAWRPTWRRCKLTLYPGWLQRVEVASVSVHRCTHVVWGLRASLGPAKRDAHWGRSTTNHSDLQIQHL